MDEPKGHSRGWQWAGAANLVRMRQIGAKCEYRYKLAQSMKPARIDRCRLPELPRRTAEMTEFGIAGNWFSLVSREEIGGGMASYFTEANKRPRLLAMVLRRAGRSTRRMANDYWIFLFLLATLLAEHSGALVLYARQWCGSPEDVWQDARRAPPASAHSASRQINRGQ